MNKFRLHPLCHDPLITHLTFVDDVLLFFDGKADSLEGIMKVLMDFYTASGLSVNLQKSYLFLDGNNMQLTTDLASRFGFAPGALPVRYLGLPLLPHKLRPADYQPLLDRVRQRISSWLVRHLSFAGRLQLIRSVLGGVVNFWTAVCPIPKFFLKEVERLCNSFLWSGAPNSSREAKVSWESVCLPKEEGGLGLRRLMTWNKVFGLKLIWLLFTKSGSLWVSWVQKISVKGSFFLGYQLGF